MSKQLSFPSQSTIFNARALAVFTSSLTLASRFGSVIEQAYQCSLFLIIFFNVFNKISEIMGLKVKSKTNVKTGFVNRQIDNFSFKNLTSINCG
jgi:hypothetical protein